MIADLHSIGLASATNDGTAGDVKFTFTAFIKRKLRQLLGERIAWVGYMSDTELLHHFNVEDGFAD